jgi:CubicO group peptidase (beta-lactamase class C family)
VTATLVGIAIEEGQIESVDVPIADYLPEEHFTDDNLRKTITVDHLLKMLSGLGWHEDGHIGGMLRLQRDEIGFILGLPMDYLPGTHWLYSTADSHLLSGVLTEATGETALDYGNHRLFDPLGISDIRWTEDAEGYNLGGTQLFLRSADMARLGLLYLRNGVWDGEQIVPAQWIEYVTEPQLSDPSAYEWSYAAHWWHIYLDGYPAMSAASGYGGQYIILVPEYDLVIVTTANSYISHEPEVYISGTRQLRQVEAILDLVEGVILPAVED